MSVWEEPVCVSVYVHLCGMCVFVYICALRVHLCISVVHVYVRAEHGHVRMHAGYVQPIIVY